MTSGKQPNVAMTDTDDHTAKVLEVLTRAVAEALDRKRRLGQYYVVWRDGRVVCIGPDAPSAVSPDDPDVIDENEGWR